MSVKKIVTEASKDALSMVTGLPVGTISSVISRFRPKWSNPHFFLDWELKNWSQIYDNELEKCLTIYQREKKRYIPMVLLYDNSKSNITLDRIVFEHKNQSYQLPDKLKAKTEDIFKHYKRFIVFWRKNYSDEEQLRLIDFKEEVGKLVLLVQRARYEFNVRTNLSLDAITKNMSSSLRQDLHANGGLDNLRDSDLANPLGMNFLLFTADGKMVIAKRARKLLVRPGELGPSSSGDLLFTDIPPNKRSQLKHFPHLRETFEELGLRKADIPENEIRFLGLARELIRGGKPEMFFCANTILSEEEFRKRRHSARDRYESKHLLFFDFGRLATELLKTDQEKHDFSSRLDRFLGLYHEKISVPLWANLAFWKNSRLASEK